MLSIINLQKMKNYKSYSGSNGIWSFSDWLRFAEYDQFKPAIFIQELIYI